MKPIKICITGSIASGKSTLIKILKDKGFKVIEADLITKDLMEKGNINYKEIVKYFPQVLDYNLNIDKGKLGEIIFNDYDKRRKLNELTHKNIYDEIVKRMNSLDAFVFVEIPLFFEALRDEGLWIDFDEIWTIYVDEKKQVERLIKRNNISREYALKMISSQMSPLEKMEMSDRIIYNDGKKEEFTQYIKENIGNWLNESIKKKEDKEKKKG